MLVESFLQGKLVKLTHHKKIVTEVTNKEGNAVRVSITPIGEIRDSYADSIFFKICDDYSVYDKANAITSEQKLTPTMKKKAFEAVVKVANSYIMSNEYSFSKKIEHWGTITKFPVFYGELVDNSYGNVTSIIREAFNFDKEPIFYYNADTNMHYLEIERFFDYGSVIYNLNTGVIELNTMIDFARRLTDVDVVFAKKTPYSILKATNTKRKNVMPYSNRYKKVFLTSQNGYGYIYDSQNNIYFTQKEYMQGATNRLMLKVDYIKALIDEMTTEFKRYYGNNVFGCAKIKHIVMPTERFDEDIAGFIFDFEKNVLEFNLKYREKTIFDVDYEETYCSNFKADMEIMSTTTNADVSAYYKLRVLGFNKIYICNSNKSELVFNSDNTLEVHIPLDKECMKAYKAFTTDKKVAVNRSVERYN